MNNERLECCNEQLQPANYKESESRDQRLEELREMLLDRNYKKKELLMTILKGQKPFQELKP